MKPRIVLASASPRRSEILQSLGIDFRVIVPNIREEWQRRTGAVEVATSLAREKARAVHAANDLVIAMDTVVALGRLKLGKPESDLEAREMLQKLSGKEHRVVTGVCLRHGKREVTGAEITRVLFRDLDAREINWYVHTGEPQDKAGGYAIQGYGKVLVKSIRGCYFNVVGFPVDCFLRCLQKMGFIVFDFMKQSV